MRRRGPVLALSALWVTAALAQTGPVPTVTDPGWTLNGAGSYATQAACIAAAEALPPPAPGATSTAKCADTTTVTVAAPLPPASPAGAYLTGPTATGALTDAAGTAWTLTAGVVSEQPASASAPAKAGYTAGVGLLLWYGGAIHQRNPACLWWDWNGSNWAPESSPAATVPPCAGVSPSGTVITTGAALTDSTLTAWSIQGGVVVSQPLGAAAPAPAGFSANVIALAWVGGVIYQENSSCQWYSWKASAAPPWTLGAAPAVTAPACTVVVTPPVTPPTGVFGVRACGNKLCSTLNGTPVLLIGGVIDGMEESFATARAAVIAAQPSSYWSGTWKTQHAGTNTARIHLDACSYLNDTACAPGTDGKNAAEVAQTIASMTAGGLYVILDEAWSAPTGQLSIGQPGFADATRSSAFWKAIADKYGSQPNVIFDLFNEPFGANVWADWETAANGGNGKDVAIVANGGSYSPFMHQNNSAGNAMVTANVPYQVEGELQLLALIRAEGATNLVLASPTGWAGEIENWLASYNANGNPDPLKNFGAAQHAYGYNKGNGPIQAVLAAGFPVVETEFMGSTVGTIGYQNALNIGISGLIGCCSNDWGLSMSLVKW